MPLTGLMQFIERFEEQNKKVPARLPPKVQSSQKPHRYNIDDTDTESDDDDQQATPTSSWVDEWKLYLNTYEVVPGNVGIVQWWGVSLHFASCAFKLSDLFHTPQANGVAMAATDASVWLADS
jgi:hypothetical protein